MFIKKQMKSSMKTQRIYVIQFIFLIFSNSPIVYIFETVLCMITLFGKEITRLNELGLQSDIGIVGTY
jgi:ABC-type antimicrobial peptide transport system permease subunit